MTMIMRKQCHVRTTNVKSSAKKCCTQFDMHGTMNDCSINSFIFVMG